jgi:transketolase
LRDAFVAAISELAAADGRIMLLTGDLGFGVLTEFEKRFPRQYLNVGVAEQNMLGLATGLALEGRVVFAYSIANFPTLRCLEQIRNDACYHDANVKIVSVGAGFSYGALGISHHATEDVSIVRALPNICIVSPGDLWEAYEATKAVATWPGTVLLRLDKSHAPATNRPGEAFHLGRARLVRDGQDATIATMGGILGEVLRAADVLAEDGIRCRILSFSTIKPLDTEALIAAVAETGSIFTVEEHTVEGGFGGAVAEIVLEMGCVPRSFYRIGLRDGFSSVVGSQQYLRSVYGLDARAIAQTVRSKVKEVGFALQER